MLTSTHTDAHLFNLKNGKNTSKSAAHTFKKITQKAHMSASFAFDN